MTPGKKADRKELLASAMEMIRDTYYRISCIDILNNSAEIIEVSEDESWQEEDFGRDYRAAVKMLAESYIPEEHRQYFLNIMLPEKLEELFDSGLPMVNFTYRRYESGTANWVRSELIPMRDYSPLKKRVMWYVKNIPEELALKERLSDKYIRMNADMNLRLETVMAGMSGGFKISRDDDVFSYYFVSRSVPELFGYTNEEFMEVTGGCAKGAVYHEDLEETLALLAIQLEAGDSYSLKYRVKCKDGSLKWIIDSGKRVTSDDGEKLFYSVYNDITELENSSIKLKNTDVMLNQVVRMLSSGILAYKMPSHEIVVLNEEAKRLFDWNDSDLDRFSFSDVIMDRVHSDDVPAVMEAVSRIKTAGDSVSYRFRVTNRNGETIKIQSRTALLSFEDGTQFILSSLQDITEQSMLSEMILDERSLYRDALTSDCLYAYNVDLTEGVIKEKDLVEKGVNVFRLFGVDSQIGYDELIDMWSKKRKPKSLGGASIKTIKRKNILEKVKYGEKSLDAEYYDPVSDKYVRHTMLFSESVRNGDIMAFVYGTDITEARKNEEQAKQALIEAYEAAKRANSAKSDFLSRMSHDIRTPLNAIIGMTDIAAANITDREKVTDCLGKITLSSNHLLSLINEILDMSKIESGKVDLNESDFTLSSLIENMTEIMRPQINAKNQTFTVKMSGIVHENVIGDNLRIQQSFLNLMSNAVKYTPEGGKISLRVAERPTRQPLLGRFEFVFEDNGIGMSPEFTKHIFEPFTRETDSRTSKIKGTGLGMAITHNLVRMMNGTIKVKSALGKGTVFTVVLPLKLQEADDKKAENAAADIKKASYPGKRVLLAEDNDLNAEITTEILKMMDITTERAENGKTAADMFSSSEANHYDLVFMDIQMPIMNGNDAARAIRSSERPDAKTVPIIAMTANAFTDDIQAALDAGMNGHLAKPLNLKLLTDTLDQWLKEK